MIGSPAAGRGHCQFCCALFALILIAGAAPVVAQSFTLKDGDTVVFYGDSITAQRFYTREVEEFVLTRYPSLHVRFINAGVPGDTAAGGYAGQMAERVERDVKPYQPSMITVMLGMNDGGWGYGSPDQIDSDFQSRYRALLQALREAAPSAALTLISATPYDEITHGTEFPGYSRMVDRLAGDISQIAEQGRSAGATPVYLADFHRPLVHALEQAKEHAPQLAPLLIPDRIHPGEATQWIMAAALMSAWHVNPVVSSVVLNADHAAVMAADRTTISQLRQSAGGLEWIQLDEALPLPFDFNDAMIPLMLQISDVADVDQQMLRVESLAPGQYELTIDGKRIAAFSSEDLRRGVNLALFQTPMLDQARDIASTEGQRAELDRARFMLSADVKQLPTSGIAEATLRAAQIDLDIEVRKKLNPKPHRFALQHLSQSTGTNASAAQE